MGGSRKRPRGFITRESSMRNRPVFTIFAAILLVVGGVTFGSVDPAEGTHPGSNGRIAFVSNPEHGGESDIWTLNPDGSDLRNVTNTTSEPNSDPAWSPDGRRLAYTAFGETAAIIRILDTTDSSTRDFVPLPGRSVLNPAWSPDGVRLAFEATDDFSAYDIWTANIDGSDPVNVTQGTGGSSRHPDWSPDGTRIAFTSDGQHSDIFAIDIDGQNRTNLTDNPLGDLRPSWSPDGTRIIFESQRHWDNPPYSNYDIYSMAADGSAVQRLTSSTNEDTRAVWSPDGSKIAFVSQVDSDPGPANSLGPMNVFIMNADGSSITHLAGDSGSYELDPSWGQLPNHAPRAVHDEVALLRGGSAVIPILDNDIDGDGDPLVVTIASPPEHGSLSSNGDGSYTYVHDNSVVPTSDSFIYQVTDWEDTDTASVSITIRTRFDDVPTEHIFFADIGWLGDAGITRGCNPPANTMFCPDHLVTRGQMAAFLVRALGYTDDGGGDLFVDDDGSVFEADIDRLGTAGVTKGCNPPTNDKFCPKDYVTAARWRRSWCEPSVTPMTVAETSSSTMTASSRATSTGWGRLG